MPGPRGVPGLGEVPAPGGVPGLDGAWSGGAWPRGCLVWGGSIPACTEADPPPVNRITHACENITLPQLRCER